MALARMFLLSCAALLLAGQSFVQAQQESPYEGKTIEVFVGFTSGGFYDRWSRLLARYVPKYLPGTHRILRSRTLYDLAQEKLCQRSGANGKKARQTNTRRSNDL